MNPKVLFLLPLTAFLLFSSPVFAAKEVKPKALPKAEEKALDAVVLRALNKVTTRSETIEIPIGGTAGFGHLEITALTCWSAPPEERPEDAILIDVRELKPEEMPQRVFVGWIFSSSPSLSSMEHPVYDITAVKCRMHAPPEAQPNPAQGPQEPAPPQKP